jgi:hypothetical protein
VQRTAVTTPAAAAAAMARARLNRRLLGDMVQLSGSLWTFPPRGTMEMYKINQRSKADCYR